MRNIYSPHQMKTMGIDDINEYKESLYRQLNILTDFEDALQTGIPNEQVLDFLREDLGNTYDTFSDLREDIENVSLPKKTFHKKTRTF